MATIDQQLGEGGRGISRESGADPLLKVLNEIADDLAALRAAHVALTAKMDLDTDLTATDWGSTTNPAALKTVKGT